MAGMRNHCATARASGTSTPAIVAAVREAREKLGELVPAFGFLFVAPSADLESALRAARVTAGTENVIGCTTAGELTEAGLSSGGASVMLVAGDVTTQMGFATGVGGAPGEVASRLARGLSETKRAAAARQHKHLTSVLLTDGLTGTAERVLEALYEARVQTSMQIVGGAAADDSAFRATHVGAEGLAGRDAAAILHVFGAQPWGVGVGHGLTPTTKQMRVTRAKDNIVHEINGEPAFAAYRRHAAERGVELRPEGAAPYMVAHELGIHFFERVSRARAPLSVLADGALACAAEVPQGSMVSILAGEPDAMIAAARSAADSAFAALDGRKAAGVLLFDCICRSQMLGSAFSREVEAVRSVFGDVPLAGFLTYGEIARRPGHQDGWHNATAVVVAIPS
jgi:methyl-accepting chemotaxis protein